jgi:hypothetical protein
MLYPCNKQNKIKSICSNTFFVLLTFKFVLKIKKKNTKQNSWKVSEGRRFLVCSFQLTFEYAVPQILWKFTTDALSYKRNVFTWALRDFAETFFQGGHLNCMLLKNTELYHTEWKLRLPYEYKSYTKLQTSQIFEI